MQVFHRLKETIIGIRNKFRFSGFVGGLIFGAFFSLVVNVTTIQLQEILDKQKYLEALELEIAGHLIQSNALVEDYTEANKRGEKTNYPTSDRYHSNMWDASNSFTYTYDMDPHLRIKLMSHYNVMIKGTNTGIDSFEDLLLKAQDRYTECLLIKEEKDCQKLFEYSKDVESRFENAQVRAAKNVFDNSYDVLKEFHPAQNRINNPFLRTFMGNEIVEVLKRE